MGLKSPYTFYNPPEGLHGSSNHQVPRRTLITLLSITASLATIWMLAHSRHFFDSHSPSPSSPQALVTEDQNDDGYGSLSDTEYPSGAAIIVETRATANLVPIMLHFSSILGPNWPVLLFTLESEWTQPSSAPFKRAMRDNRIRIRYLPPETSFHNHHSVSLFLTSPWLWEQVLSAPRVLLFQTDSIICANANSTIESFAQYDLIGAPIDPQYGVGYNGGLSLRNPRLMLDIANREGRDFEAESEGGEWFVANEKKFEDQWFYLRAKERQANLPEPEVAKTFAVETTYYGRPLGFHQPSKWQAENMREIVAWCPEVGMLQDNGRFLDGALITA